MAAVLLSGLGFSLWRDGGLAFNPGALSAKAFPGVSLGGYASHAEFESECQRCHQPLASPQAPLCLECHDGVAAQIEQQDGVHGAFESVQACAGCHSDHHGREFDPTSTALEHFDHANAGFDLLYHHLDYDGAPLACTGCHIRGEQGFPFDAAACNACHLAAEPAFSAAHTAEMGLNCRGCHDGVDRMRGFDHDALSFHLDGKHEAVACSACHVTAAHPEGIFAGLPTACAECHAEPEMHRGFFDSHCADCHTPQGWSPAVVNNQFFAHANSRFTLDRHVTNFDGSALQCADCHLAGVAPGNAPDCITCHAQAEAAFVAEHRAAMGDDCLQCHDGVDRMRGFDHAQVFALDGRHAEIECAACHDGQRFAGTPNACADCHAEPDIHAGAFGLQCQACHATTGWTPAFLTQHSFPLDHGEQGDIACETCHTVNYIEYTCYGCHEHEPAEIQSEHLEEGVSQEELPACVNCHPNGREEDE